MDIKVKRRTDRSIEVTFSDVSTKTTIPLSISDVLSLQLKLANSLSASFNLSPVMNRKDFSKERDAEEKSIYGGTDTSAASKDIEDEDYLPNAFNEGGD